MNNKSGLKALVQYPEFLKIWLGRVISRLGDSIDSIAYMWMVYELTGSTVLMGTLMAVNFLPNLIFGPVAGVFVDRWKKKSIVFLGDIGRGLVVAVTAMLLLACRLEVWVLFVCTFINSTIESFVAPARTSIIPKLVTDEEDLLAANSITSAASSLAQIVGIGVAGWIVSTWGTPVAILIDAGSFFTCALCVLVTRIPVSEHEQREQKHNAKSFAADFKEGLKIALGQPILRTCILLGVTLNFALSPFNVLNPIYADKVLHSGPDAYAKMALSLSIAMMIGSLILGQYGKRFKSKTLLTTGLTVLTIGFMTLFIARSVMLAVLGSACIGAGASFVSGTFISLFMKHCKKEAMGRVAAVMNSLLMAAMPASTAIAGLLAEWINIPIIYLGTGTIIGLATLCVICSASLKATEKQQDAVIQSIAG